MTKFSVAIAFAISLTAATAAYAEQPDYAIIEDLNPECVALTLSPNGEFSCIAKDDSKHGKFYFTTRENNGSVIVRGYPWMDIHGTMGRIDAPTDYQMCQGMVKEAWFPRDEETKEYFGKYNEIWCVREGE